jgi:hypothetical protein
MILRRRDPEKIQNYIRKMQRDIDNTLREINSLVYFMRGGLQYSDAKLLTVPERRLMHEFLSERLEQESKKQYPCY